VATLAVSELWFLSWVPCLARGPCLSHAAPRPRATFPIQTGLLRPLLLARQTHKLCPANDSPLAPPNFGPMDQLRLPTSPPPSGNSTQNDSQLHHRTSTPYGDLKHSSSYSGSYEFSQETKTFNEPSVSDETINPARASHNATTLAPRRVVTKKNRWVRIPRSCTRRR